MALIKNRDAGRLVSRGFQDLGDLRRQADELVENARVEAQRIIDEARAQAKTLVDEAAPRGLAEGRQQGLDEGRTEGRRAGREEALAEFTTRLETLVSSWTETMTRFDAQRDELLHAAREDVLEFALVMGAKITRRVIKADPAVVRDQVAEALALLAAPSRVTVSIHPEDRKIVESVVETFQQGVAGGRHVEFRDDPEVERGGCVLTTGSGRIDATIERQIERIAKALRARQRAATPHDGNGPDAAS